MRGRTLRVFLLAVAAILVLGGGGIAYATYDYARAYEDKLLPGTKIAGVELGGMDRAEALTALGGALGPQLDRPITVTWERHSWVVTARDLGAEDNTAELVDAALAEGRSTSFLHKMRMKVLGSRFQFAGDVSVDVPPEEVRGFIEEVAAKLNREARDATVDYDTGWVEVVPESDGRKLRIGPSTKALMNALTSGESAAQLKVATTEPEKTTEAFDQVLLVRIGENKLYLYEDGEITQSWPVATGLPEYPTPSGIYEITLKRYMPTWVNPSPDTWGKDLPKMIPPGPGNPLGLRALNWSAPAIRFHGTSATYSLGYNASHGCVRMSNEDVIELYDMVEVGTPIVSTVVAPYRPLYVSAPDPTVVAEDSGDDSAGTGSDKPKRKSG